MEFGEVHLCRLPHTDGAPGKPRPALILFVQEKDVVVCRVTSVKHNEPEDVELNEWEHAGLRRSSVARLTRLVTAEHSMLKRKLGNLSPSDTARVRETWNDRMRL